MTAAVPLSGGRHGSIALLLRFSDAIAAILLATDLVVVCGSVLLRFCFNAPVEWSDDVARGLMVGSAFFGAASALARGENVGVSFFRDLAPVRLRALVDAASALLVVLISGYVAYNAIKLGSLTAGQTTGSGLPLELTFYPMGAGALFMTVFAIDQLCARPLPDIVRGLVAIAVVTGLYLAWDYLSPATVPSAGTLMLIGFFATLVGGLPIGFALALAALIFIWVEGALPGVIFAQQMARGIDNFVLLAIPFFILVGYLMEANGMSVRLIELLQRGVGRMRGGLNVVMVASMVLFSGISGSKMADVAAVGSVLIPAARRSKQNPGGAVALLAASAVMAETIPPCINLIILGFVANLSIGGLFVAGLLPAALMALALIAVSIIFGKTPIETPTESPADAEVIAPQMPVSGLWSGAIASFGLIFMIFFGFKSGFATATEISAFAVAYALVVGSVVFRELSFTSAAHSFVQGATRAGLVLFIVAAAQSLAFTLTLQQVPHAVGDFMLGLSKTSGTWLFILLAIGVLIVMGSVLEGAAALIIFGPLLLPVAVQLGIDPLHFGVVLVIAMGIGLFAPPLGLGLYGACLIGNVPIEQTVKPIMGYLGLLFLCLLVIAFVPWLSTALPRAFGY
ncbi:MULTISPECIES: TRAP transporter large permease subunit [Bradyrhizobium]|jgi:tripartite ATP-independent transporter DctM subunit|nr:MULTISPECIES: TRAP transporter large permease subunit [Bradyrhizobium]MCK1270978.1 TRAP transporter large permease subunit [Bradyrhizobium sp. 84]MCK1295567.1 TRAP transporter large permease subunit [Bradyrhizobium sp. 30]MCK1309280.1 TRAP transporter large permease subunit [Bradyrhizobium sp. 45]MCK1316161.1 TRAP transporter large permease subunit [Bradyrhizobium sp. 23]MCK1321104.1 TRAP transporter large permease subunit [Bradyrhizobium sp. 156]